MAGDEDKKHDATPTKLKDAKKKGNVSKSQDVGTAVGLVSGFGAMIAMKGFFLARFDQTFKYCFEQLQHTDKIDVTHLLMFILQQVAMLSMPVLVAVLVAGVVAQYGMVGVIFTGEQLKPKIEKINPMKGIKRWFSMKSLVELAKSLVKVLVMFLVGAMVWKNAFDIIAGSVMLDPIGLMALGGKLIASLFYKVIGLFVVLAAVDYMFQKKQWKKDLKMSDKEIKDEYKNQEGDPYQKAKRRQMAQQIAMQSSTEFVPQADAIIINPTEIAVALKFDQDLSPVPFVLAKGDKRLADDIRQAAREAGVPIIRNKPLARALFELCEIGDIVPADLYKPVAEVLAYVFALRGDNGTDAAAAASQVAAANAAASTSGEALVHEPEIAPVPDNLVPTDTVTAAGWAPAPTATANGWNPGGNVAPNGGNGWTAGANGPTMESGRNSWFGVADQHQTPTPPPSER